MIPPLPMTSSLSRRRRWGPLLVAASALVTLAAPASAAPPRTAPGASATALNLPPTARLVWDAAHTTVLRLDGVQLSTAAATPEAAARAFLAEHAALLHPVGPLALRELRSAKFANETRYFVRFIEQFGDAFVDGRDLVITLDQALRVRSMTNDLTPLHVTPPTHLISAEDAAARAAEAFFFARADHASLMVLPHGPTARVAWRVRVTALPMVAWFHVWVDAETGAILAQRPAAADQIMRSLTGRGEHP